MSVLRTSAAIIVGLALLAGCAEAASDDVTQTGAELASAAVAFDPSVALDIQLNDAIATGDTALAIAVIAEGIDPDAELPVGLPPIHYAAQMNQSEIVSLLIEAGAAIEEADSQGRTPLMIAASFSEGATVQALLDAGADIDAGNPMLVNRTAWQYAGQYGNVPALEVLFEAGVPINAVDDSNSSALHTASYGGNLEAVEFLLAHGIDPNLRDLANTTARGWAEYHGDNEIAEAITAAGGVA
jgi:ankyrin repeat protein